MVRQTWTDLGNVSHVMDFIYDNNGKPYAFYYDGTLYYYITNLQGDVIRIIDTAGATICTYTYDAWGRLLNSSTNQIFKANPIRYRGYYYDAETGLYYLGSRYYDPAVKRFINADDAALATINPYSDGLTDKNYFAYCDNNPTSRSDDGGELWNLVVGAAVGGIIGGVSAAISSYKDSGSVNISAVIVGAGTGALGGLIGATGLSAGTQAIASGVISAVNNIASAKISGQKVKWTSVAIDAFAGAASSLIGSAATKKAAAAAEKQIQRGVRRVVSAKTRYNNGSRFWKGAAKRGIELIQRGNRAMNTARGKASVIGSGISGAFGLLKCGLS